MSRDEFVEVASDDTVWRFEREFLESNWTCLYGAGCKGILDHPAAELSQGCCSLGAHFGDGPAGVDEAMNVAAYAAMLTPEQFQYHDVAHAAPDPDADGEANGIFGDRERTHTRVVDGACIFLNRKGYEAPGFTGSFGCVLHHLAQKENRHFVDTKPDVCWQLPLRRSFETREIGEREYSITVIGEYERLAWGDGGDDFDWYCTSNTEAHVGSEPVYISNRAELTAMMGQDAYDILAKHCDVRVQGIKDAQARSLPLFVIQHPATLQAGK